MEVHKLQRYDLVERIAAGGMGEVFRARATGPHGFEKTLAVKRILPELSSDSEFVESFVRESKLAVSLSHANIVQVFDLGRAGNDLFLVMEYVHGSDLARLLLAARARGMRIPVPLALLITTEAAQGLAYAHGRSDVYGFVPHGTAGGGVIHCDISPSNLLCSYAGEVKLTDFGVAQLIDPGRHGLSEPESSHFVMGKWRYMAPEQIRGEPVDARTDLYALGVVLYEILAGRKLFPGDGVKATTDQVLAGEATPIRALRPDVPEELARLISRLIALNPADRPQSAREFLSEALAIQSALPERVTPLDLGALVRELVPPPPGTPRRARLAAPPPAAVEAETSRTDSSSSVTERPTVSFLARVDDTGSGSITQWIPTTSLPGEGEAGPAGRGALHRGAARWRMGGTLAAIALMLIAAVGVGLATGMRMRRLPSEPRAADPALADAPGLALEASRAVRPLPQPPIEKIPRELSSLLPAHPEGDRTAARPGAAEPERRRQPVGYLDIYVEPWANVILDGRELDKPTPLTRIPVRPGSHRLKLVNPILNKARQLDVMVAVGQTQKVEVYLEEN